MSPMATTSNAPAPDTAACWVGELTMQAESAKPNASRTELWYWNFKRTGTASIFGPGSHRS